MTGGKRSKRGLGMGLSSVEGQGLGVEDSTLQLKCR